MFILRTVWTSFNDQTPGRSYNKSLTYFQEEILVNHTNDANK